ncbi:GGDEF domain-containing protein [Salisediminibacterium beveridgei]|uniref:Diguanylate cyclase with PAS/PAC sensor n=1 Tax=Salisediminibacterium beveridgei TaxID=632773 RepID=A0A1D7QZM3_9BACI|nr:GGDEF domain-containing protein [Salisediminibacterium beveridgei]AOM84464.1 diguanylate cyclase with PAS/PAC sensor [Salisediminibacterium beveridgei]
MGKINLNQFEQLKRKFYILIFPVIIFSSAFSYIFFLDPTKTYDPILLPVLIIAYSAGWILLILNRGFNFVEIMNLILIGVFHILKFQEVVVERIVQNQELSIGAAPFWTPLLFIFIFIILMDVKAFVYSLIIWIFNFSLFFIYWSDLPIGIREQALHYNLSIFVYIIFLYFFRKIIHNNAQNELLTELAFKDELTGVANRRQIYEWLHLSYKNKEKPVSVIMLDIDFFKKVNDIHGHLIGDKVLIELTKLIENELSDQSYLGRWGGEEFIILSYQTKDQAKKLAETIQGQVESYSFIDDHPITISLGVEEMQQDDTVDSLVNRADKLLYHAKESGRNRVCSDLQDLIYS